jgi:K(+)-stimulated pyrophosphate-energized sodium pump
LTGDRIVHRLDSVGNTTKALTKGFAIATAVVAAVALFHSFVEDSRLVELINVATANSVALKEAFGGLPVDVPIVFIGLLIGGAAPFLFSAFSIMAVGRSAFQMIHEVRRQFRERPGIMAGTEKPDYGRCVEIVTAAAQKELLGPGVLAIALPIAVGFGLSIGAAPVMLNGKEYVLTGAQALGGYLAGAILTAQLLAVLLANSGGAWDNAKKRIEDGFLGGKGTDAHKAGVIGDTVGDPFKDTAGPALNPLIKVMNLVSILIAPVVIQPLPNGVRIAVTAVAVAALLFSIFWSKRGSIAETIEEELGYHVTEEVVEGTTEEEHAVPVAGGKDGGKDGAKAGDS